MQSKLCKVVVKAVRKSGHEPREWLARLRAFRLVRAMQLRRHYWSKRSRVVFAHSKSD